jgi:cobalamin biosynthetic protein CobC
MSDARDHGGGLDAAVAEFGGERCDWLDLSTGINPVPYPVGDVGLEAWTALPDRAAQSRLLDAARAFWNVPEGVEIVAAPGASALIAQMPFVFAGRRVEIPAPTYNEHAAAFRACGWQVVGGDADLRVVVHPNNPDGRLWDAPALPAVIDESFCDVTPAASHVGLASGGLVVLKSFGKFWGLAGMRLGFAICAPEMAAKLRDGLGPWAVSGPALEIGARALEDIRWARSTRVRLAADAARLNALMAASGAEVVGGTNLFGLYDVGDAAAFQQRLARAHIWTRVFPYSDRWVRLGLPAPEMWPRLEAALA